MPDSTSLFGKANRNPSRLGFLKNANLEFASSKDVWGLGFYIYCGLIAQVFSLFTHVGGPPSQILLVEAIRFMLSCANTVATLSLSRLFFASNRSIVSGLAFNLLANSLVGFLDNTAYGFLLGQLNLYNIIPIEQRAYSALILGPILFLVYVSGFQGNRQRRKLNSRISALRRELAYLTNYSNQLVDDDLNLLTEKVRDRLTPKVDYVKSTLQSASSANDTLSLLRFMNEADIRPTAAEVSDSPARSLEREQQADPLETISIDAKFSFAASFKPLLTLFLATVQYLILILAARLPISWASLASFVVIATVIKVVQLIASGSQQEMLARTVAKISFFIIVISFGAWIVGLYFGNTDAYNSVATIAAIDMGILIVAGTSLVSQYNQQLTRELKLATRSLKVAVVKIRQQQWLSRRRVASQVQLDVQGAVANAISRLAQLESSDETLVELARKDLDLALDALRTVPELSFLIRDQLEELRLAWSGVCEIEIKMTEAVQLIIDGDKSNALIVNAVVNEAVVNAVRLGRASWIGVTLIAPNAGFLEMEVRDNGHLGTSVVMGDAAREILSLTTKSTLSKVGPLTVGTAEIPISDSRRTE